MEELERDGAIQAGILGAINHAHAALSELLGNLIVLYPLTDHTYVPGPAVPVLDTPRHGGGFNRKLRKTGKVTRFA
jgi:hypothetical protein